MLQTAQKMNKKNSTKSQMRITSRIVNVRRHTTGYLINGKEYTVAQARNMASKGQIAGVRVVGNHLQATSGSRRLVDLPTQVRKSS